MNSKPSVPIGFSHAENCRVADCGKALFMHISDPKTMV
jgi:hypothetical protein